ncbi:MAG: hypothetical protein GY754_25420 [bacterium]|nr:hypothetical protein [bacterium]
MNTLRRLPVLCVVLIFFSLTACFTRTVAIKDVKKDELKYRDKPIFVEGEVTDTQTFPFRDDGVYRIFNDDNTESIWIYSKNKPFPERGSKIRVKGTLRKKDDIRKKIMGPVLIEENRELKDS